MPTATLTAPEMETVSRPVSKQDVWKCYAKQGAGGTIESEITERYLPLVRTVVGRIAMTLPAHVDAEDLYSSGLVGLLNAIRRYDPTSGTSFETYARVRIRGAVLDELRRLDWVPRSVHDKARKVEVVMRDLEQQKGRVPNENEMAKALNMSLDDYTDLIEQIRPATFICLDSARDAENEDGSSQYESIPDASQVDPGDCSARRELSRIVAERIESLPEMQRKVLALYYFEDLRLREIAAVFGVTESRICQIHSRAILTIKSFLAKHDPCVA